MRFMMLMKNDEQAEAGVTPDEKLFEAMGQYNQALIDSGAMLAGEGLLPSSKGVKIKFQGGKPTVTDGPFAETKEVIGGYWIIQAGSLAEAVEWAKRCFQTVAAIAGPQAGAADGTGEIEVRQMFDVEDFPTSWREREAPYGGTPSVQPQPGLKQFVVFGMASKDSEAGAGGSEEGMTALGKYYEELTQRGVFLTDAGLRPSSRGAKVRYANGKISVIDGPFTESKELIAGFALLQARSLAELVELVKQWPAGNGDLELRIRQVATEEDFGPELTPELRQQEEQQRAQVVAQQPAKR